MAVDLSRDHHLVSDLFKLPVTRDQWDAYQLTAEQVQFYHEHGYLAGVRLFSNEQVEVLRGQLSGVLQGEYAGCGLWYEYHSNESADARGVLFHALGAWRILPGFHDLLWNPAFTVPASQLLGGAVRFWHDQLFCKPPHHGGVVAWHQDYSYWTRTRPMAHLTCWIGLDDSSRDNGCLHYIPGSHRWQLLDVTELAGDMNAIDEVLSESQRRALRRGVPVELKRGECSFHHPLTVHGSFANSTSRPRRATVINVFRDGVCSATDDPLLDGVPAVPSGHLMDGPFFPLLLDPSHIG